jgi:hypothetical protein
MPGVQLERLYYGVSDHDAFAAKALHGAVNLSSLEVPP